MKYNYLTDERKKCIDELVESLRNSYSVDSKIDFQSLAKDFGVLFSETDRLSYGAVTRRNGRYYVFTVKHFIPYLTEYGKAHEFGHVLLKHHFLYYVPKEFKEDEADYFAENLTGVKMWKIDLLINLFIIPKYFLYFLSHPTKLHSHIDDIGFYIKVHKLIREIDTKQSSTS